MTVRALLAAGLACAALAGCGKTPDVTNGTVPQMKAAAAPAPAGQKWTDVVSQTPDGGYVMGNPAATLKLVEYGSRTCPTCGLFGREGMRPLEEKYVSSGKVSYEFRDFMVHAPDLGVDLLGRCAGPGPYFPILEQMYVAQLPFLDKLEAAAKDTGFINQLQAASPTQGATMWAERLGYVDFMKQHGLTEAQARACLSDPKQIKVVTDLTEKAMNDAGVSGTPTFVLNGQKVDGASWPQVEQALKAAGA